MKKANLGDYFEWNGQIVKCTWINTGQKSIGFVVKEKENCPHCGKEIEREIGHDMVESSPNFQERAKPITTIS